MFVLILLNTVTLAIQVTWEDPRRVEKLYSYWTNSVLLPAAALRTVQNLQPRHGHPQHGVHRPVHRGDAAEAAGPQTQGEPTMRLSSQYTLTQGLRGLLLCQHYFVDAWNSFDALIVVGSVVDIVVTEFSVSVLCLKVGETTQAAAIMPVCLPACPPVCLSACLSVCPSEWGGQLSCLYYLLPPVSSDAIGQAAE